MKLTLSRILKKYYDKQQNWRHLNNCSIWNKKDLKVYFLVKTNQTKAISTL